MECALGRAGTGAQGSFDSLEEDYGREPRTSERTQPSDEAAARRSKGQARRGFERTQLRYDPNEPSRRRA
jgi:hypothetical protein